MISTIEKRPRRSFSSEDRIEHGAWYCRGCLYYSCQRLASESMDESPVDLGCWRYFVNAWPLAIVLFETNVARTFASFRHANGERNNHPPSLALPRDHEMKTNPAEQFYDRISHAYDLIADGGEHVARERGLELLAAKPGESVLEIGFGTGHSLVALAEAVGDTGSVSGVDISSGMRDVAKKRLAKDGHDQHVRLVVQETPPLPFADGGVSSSE